MEFSIYCCHCCYSFAFVCLEDILPAFVVAGFPMGLLWLVRIIYRWNVPWFEGRDLARLEFPAPPVRMLLVEPIPVELMVGNCSEAKRCAYCHEEFENDSTRRFCFSCGSAAHEECAALNGGCSVYGCATKAVS